MKQLRRLDVMPKDPYKRALKQPLRHVALSPEAFKDLQSMHADHVLIEDDGILIAQPYQGVIGLQYAFPNSDAFVKTFPPMFARILPALTLEEAPMGMRFRLTDGTSRPYVEPILESHAFQESRDWVRMELRELPSDGVAEDAVSDGFLLREARIEDAEAISELDAVAFPMSWLTPDIVRDTVEQGPVFRVLEDTEEERAVGYLRLRTEGATEGHISDVALHPDYQRRGLGEAIMRWALARFKEDGQQGAALTVSTDNGPAIALYRKLGFTAGEAGIDYRRPIDEDEVRQILDKNRASHITVRKRY
jgi:ribosomal protein S18 acetylase RimI-like enzyme